MAPGLPVYPWLTPAPPITSSPGVPGGTRSPRTSQTLTWTPPIGAPIGGRAVLSADVRSAVVAMIVVSVGP